MRNSKKGFTLAELLIVVAIIAVLVAIAIPVFNSQLEKAREGVDLANVRSAYAEAKTAALGGATGKTYYKAVTGTQSTAGFKYVDISALPEGLGTAAETKAVLETLATGVTVFVTSDADGEVGIVAAAPSGGENIDS